MYTWSYPFKYNNKSNIWYHESSENTTKKSQDLHDALNHWLKIFRSVILNIKLIWCKKENMNLSFTYYDYKITVVLHKDFSIPKTPLIKTLDEKITFVLMVTGVNTFFSGKKIISIVELNSASPPAFSQKSKKKGVNWHEWCEILSQLGLIQTTVFL